MKSATLDVAKVLRIPSDLLLTLDKTALLEMLEAFTHATGLTANIVTTKGTSIFNLSDAQKNSEFCQLISELEQEKEMNRCADAYHRAGKLAVMYQEPYIFRCPAGLIEWIAPIVVDGTHLGSVICGQVLMWEPEEYFWVELEQMNQELTSSCEPLIDAAQDLQVVSAAKAHAASRLLGIIANMIAKMLWAEVKYEQEYEYQCGLLEEEMRARQSLERELSAHNLTHYFDKEHSLIMSLSKGNPEDSRKLFDVTLEEIMLEAEDIYQAEARLIELFVAMSRAALDMRVDHSKTQDINVKYIKAVRMAMSLDMLADISKKTFEEYLSIMQVKTESMNRSVEAIKGYIHRHHKDNLTLQDIADSVSLSQHYASRLFKQEQGITIMEYVASIKIDEAKKLLNNPLNKIEDIAEYLGYDDPSYFTRVFKKRTGVTPSQFRVAL